MDIADTLHIQVAAVLLLGVEAHSSNSSALTLHPLLPMLHQPLLVLSSSTAGMLFDSRAESLLHLDLAELRRHVSKKNLRSPPLTLTCNL